MVLLLVLTFYEGNVRSCAKSHEASADLLRVFLAIITALIVRDFSSLSLGLSSCSLHSGGLVYVGNESGVLCGRKEEDLKNR